MKNQNDLIISISVGVVALIVAIVIYATAPQPTRPSDPPQVDTSAPKLPAADVRYTNGLGGSSNAMGGMPGGMGPMGPGGPGMMGRGGPGMMGPGGSGMMGKRGGMAPGG